MPFYIVFKNPLKPGDINFLLAHGHKRIHKGLWIANHLDSDPKIDNLLSLYSAVVLKSSRTLRSPMIDNEKGIFDLGSLILVAYDLPYEPRVRKSVNRLIRRGPCFRLSPSIYLFPHAKYEKYDKTPIVPPSDLVKHIVVHGGKVICIPRLFLLNTYYAKQVVEELNALLIKRVESINQIVSRLKTTEKQEKTKLFSETRLEVKTLNAIIKFFEEEVGLNFQDANLRLRKIWRVLAQQSR